jgi:GTP cyclohydrolase I
MELRRRDLSDEQLQRFESYAAEIFRAFGLDLDTPATRETPRRFIRALYDPTAGYDGDPKLLTVFDTECHGGSDCRLSQVIEGPIQTRALLQSVDSRQQRGGWLDHLRVLVRREAS